MGWIGPRSIDGGLDQLPLPATSGALWLCGKRVVTPDPIAALERAGRADTIVCFNERAELEGAHPDYVAWLESNAGVAAVWHPIPDLHAPPLEEAQRVVADLVLRLDAGDGLVLHCAGGIGRAPTMAICVLIRLGMHASDAARLVAECRPTAGPEAGAQRTLIDSFV